ncbi:MAG TPA: hypothetical protein DIT18_05965, partial [Pseudomonas sp.]|nr:hypothetical protein [Pseudomonas sp.]
MDNFMENPSDKMNRGGILAQGWRQLAYARFRATREAESAGPLRPGAVVSGDVSLVRLVQAHGMQA